MNADYTVLTTYDRSSGQWVGRYEIREVKKGVSHRNWPVVWTRHIRDGEDASPPYPPDVQSEYEGLMNKNEPVEMIKKIAEAIESVPYDWLIKLIRLVDGVSTYMVEYRGEPQSREFMSYQEAMDYCASRRSEAQARIAIGIIGFRQL